MDDQEIIARFFARDEEGLTAARARYEPYCAAVARNLLTDPRDQEECLSDTWLRAWNAIPPQRPRSLGAFLAKITRNLAINRLRDGNAQRRGGGQVPLALEELGECVSPEGSPEGELDRPGGGGGSKPLPGWTAASSEGGIPPAVLVSGFH